MVLIYFLVALLSTICGSMAGLGGGVIIKPVLDFLGDYNIETIGVLSACTIFSMALVSVIKQLSYKSKIDIKNTGLLGIGSVIGGLLGQKLLTFILKIFQKPSNKIIELEITA